MDTRIAFAALVILLSSCQPKVEKIVWAKPATEQITCADYATAPTASATLYNNVWNKQAAKSFQWRQCLEKDPVSGDFGWSWSWPDDGNAIFGYPQIKIGTSPWAPDAAAHPDFPLDLRRARSVIVEHQLQIAGNSELNIATSMWLTNTDKIGTTQNSAVIVAELMIWTYSSPGHMNPAGKHVEDIEFDGVAWEVWVERDWSDASGANENKWVYLTFRAKQNMFSAKFDAINFTRYGIQKRLLAPASFIADIEVGTEIKQGSGLAWVKKFSTVVSRQ